jgi:hypothetical protein
MRGFGVGVKLRISFGGIYFLGRGGDRKDLTQRSQRNAENTEKAGELSVFFGTGSIGLADSAQAGLPVPRNLICGLAGSFGTRLEEFLYALDVGGEVYAYGVVHGFDYVHAEAVFQPAELLELFDAF